MPLLTDCGLVSSIPQSQPTQLIWEAQTQRLFRVAVVSFTLPVLGQKRGGIERVAHDLAEGLARRGHEVTVWSTDPKPGGASYQVRELPWRSFSQNWLGRRLLFGYLGNILAVL